jgi:hypothetical protein
MNDRPRTFVNRGDANRTTPSLVISRGIALKVAVISLLIPGLLGCASTAWQPVDPASIRYPVSLLRVTLANGDQYEVFEAEVNDIGVTGQLAKGGRFFALLEDIKKAEVSISAKKNVSVGLWIAIPIVIAGVIAIIGVDISPDA